MRQLLAARLFPILALAVLLAACTGQQPSPASPTPSAQESTPTPEPTPVVSPAPSGSQGGALTVAAPADIPHRDVHQAIQPTLTSLGPGLAYSRLLRLRSGNGIDQPNLMLECDLCQGWTLTDDFAYEFQLRPGIHWQDIAPVDGRPLVAEDLVFSYNRLQTPGWPNAGLLSSRGIDSFQAVDDGTLRVELAFLDSDALLALADGHSKIVAPEVVEEFGGLRDSPVVGTGPWMWQETTQGVGTTLVSNPDYFEPGLPFLDQLNIRVINEPLEPGAGDQARLAAFRTGLVDVATVPPDQWQGLEGSSQAFESFVSHRAGGGAALSVNVRAAPLNDLAVRRAVFQALDPWEYVDLVWGGQGFVSAGVPVQRASWLLEDGEMRSRYFANPSRARDLLADTGLDLPVEVELLVADYSDSYLELGQRVAKDLENVGIRAEVRQVSPSRYRDMMESPDKDYQIALGALPPVSTTNGFLFSLLHSKGPWNVTGHQDEELDALIEEQAGEMDPARRGEQLAELQEYLLGNGYLFSPVSGDTRWVFNPQLEGFHPNTALSEYIFWSRAWLEQ